MWGLGSPTGKISEACRNSIGKGLAITPGSFLAFRNSSKQTAPQDARPWVRRIVIGLIVVALIIAIYQFVGVEMLGIGKAGHHPGHHPPPPPLHGGARPSQCPAASAIRLPKTSPQPRLNVAQS